MSKKKQGHKSTRREFVKKATYIAPAILTLAAAPQFAKAGSGKTPASKAPPAMTNKP
jgi:hypothetical protein